MRIRVFFGLWWNTSWMQLLPDWRKKRIGLHLKWSESLGETRRRRASLSVACAGVFFDFRYSFPSKICMYDRLKSYFSALHVRALERVLACPITVRSENSVLHKNQDNLIDRESYYFWIGIILFNAVWITILSMSTRTSKSGAVSLRTNWGWRCDVTWLLEVRWM